MSRFLIAASALTASALVQGANWIPSSPLVQIGNDCDIYFDAAASSKSPTTFIPAPPRRPPQAGW